MKHVLNGTTPASLTQPGTAAETNPFSLDGQLALITGGGTGIGLETARCMVAAGATGVITGRRATVLQEARQELGAAAHYLVNDVDELNSPDALLAEIEALHGPLDILVNNAGSMKEPTLDVPDAESDRVLHTNLHVVFALTRACARRMVARRKGVLLMTSSMAAHYGIDRVVAYAASKPALQGMVKVLASEFSKDNVRVNAIAPGFIETEMSRPAMTAVPERRDRAMRRTPMGKFGQPAEFGHAAVFLASSAARYVTGASLPVDGGNSIGF